MRHLRDIAFDMAADLTVFMEDAAVTDDRRKLILRTIDEFKTWDAARAKRNARLKAKAVKP